MDNSKPTASNNKNRNDSMLMFRLLAAGYILYMAWQIVKAYMEGGEEAPSVLILVLSIVLLGGGAVFILVISLKQYRANKQQIEEQIAQARAEAEQEEQAALEEAEELTEPEEEDTQEEPDDSDEPDADKDTL